MAITNNLNKKFESVKKTPEENREILSSLDSIGLFTPFRKKVEILLSSHEEEDALNHEVTDAIISWNQKLMGIPEKQMEIYAAADDYKYADVA